MATSVAMSPDVLINIKLQVGTENRRFKLPLRELGAHTLPDKLRSLLAVPPTKNVVFERYSDSAGKYITLDSSNSSVYKQLYRAAKAKLKLRIKATITDAEGQNVEALLLEPVTPDCLTSHCYLPPMNLLSGQPDIANDTAMATVVKTVPAIPTPSVQPNGPAFMVPQAIPTAVSPMESSNTIVGTITKTASPIATKHKTDAAASASRSLMDADLYAELAGMSGCQPPSLRALDQSFPVSGSCFTVCCNSCNTTIPNVHWHCSICDEGDYDLCHSCVTIGVHCGGDGHFLIKRLIANGKVTSSTTETVPKKPGKVENEKEVPGAFAADPKEEHLPEMAEMSRTCNCCVTAFEESNFVTCTVCEDYDLCIPCHVGLKHGHHPSHAFTPVGAESTLDGVATLLCAPGRNMRHFAICDGCDLDIFGVRHKCMDCPDWDYCDTCMQSARQIHPGHRFVPVYKAISGTIQRPQVHHGINCDGPLCVNKESKHWIVGDRFKCAVCHDTDFCASCEALPTLRHNRSHPLIKFRTPVRNVCVTTLGEKEDGAVMCTMGDKIPHFSPRELSERCTRTSSKSTETTPAAPSANAATQVQTVAEVKPSEAAPAEPQEKQAPVSSARQLQAHFVRDTINDGSKLPPGCQIQQVWILRNPGPDAWPAGCSVRFIGGDNMLNVDPKHPSSIGDIVKATESNKVDRVVEVGEEACFFVTIKTPQRCGKAISYWRLKAADSTPFGHKLWCDIDVVDHAPMPADQPETEHIEDIAKEVKKVTCEAVEEDTIKQDVIGDTDMIQQEEIKEELSEEGQQSQMVFPKLEKESPASSTHEIKSEPHVAVLPSALTTEEQALLEDVESLELDDDSTSDDGFMTDEEYEILDVDEAEAINGKK